MSNLSPVLEGVGSANRGKPSVEDLSQALSDFSCRIKERPANSRQRAVILSDSYHQRAKIRRLREQRAHWRLPITTCVVNITLLETYWHPNIFSALAAANEHVTNCCRCRASKINDE